MKLSGSSPEDRIDRRQQRLDGVVEEVADAERGQHRECGARSGPPGAEVVVAVMAVVRLSCPAALARPRGRGKSGEACNVPPTPPASLGLLYHAANMRNVPVSAYTMPRGHPEHTDGEDRFCAQRSRASPRRVGDPTCIDKPNRFGRHRTQ